MLWRNVIYHIVINAFQSVKDVAPHLPQQVVAFAKLAISSLVTASLALSVIKAATETTKSNVHAIRCHEASNSASASRALIL